MNIAQQTIGLANQSSAGLENLPSGHLDPAQAAFPGATGVGNSQAGLFQGGQDRFPCLGLYSYGLPTGSLDGKDDRLVWRHVLGPGGIIEDIVGRGKSFPTDRPASYSQGFQLASAELLHGRGPADVES